MSTRLHGVSPEDYNLSNHYSPNISKLETFSGLFDYIIVKHQVVGVG
jgi:hypothetical protein